MTLNSDNIRTLIMMRGLGYKQQEIADKLNVSIKTIQSHLKKLKRNSEDSNRMETFFWEILLNNSALELIIKITKEKKINNKLVL